MNLSLLKNGEHFYVYALVLDDGCVPAIEFLEALEKSNIRSYEQLLAVIERHAKHGPLRNRQQSNTLDDKILEFKCRGVERLAYAYLPGKRTVITHGFKKPKNYNEEIKRARDYMNTLEGQL